MKFFKTVFLVGLATIALGSAAMGADPAPVPCNANSDAQTKQLPAAPGGTNTQGAPTANGANNGTTPPPAGSNP